MPRSVIGVHDPRVVFSQGGACPGGAWPRRCSLDLACLRHGACVGCTHALMMLCSPLKGYNEPPRSCVRTKGGCCTHSPARGCTCAPKGRSMHACPMGFSVHASKKRCTCITQNFLCTPACAELPLHMELPLCPGRHCACPWNPCILSASTSCVPLHVQDWL